MSAGKRIQLNKYQFAELISEVNGLCPLCSEPLIDLDVNRQFALSQAAHIYPHSPTEEEKNLLASLPKLSNSPESIDNLIMLCPNCHQKFDHPRTQEGYIELYRIKDQLIRRNKAKQYYQTHNIEDEIIRVLKCIGEVNILANDRKLSYNALTVSQKMSINASKAVKNIVTRDARDYYLVIRDSLQQIELDSPGKSELIAKEVSLFYSSLKVKGLSQDDIYYAINDWLDVKTHRQYSLLTPFITAFYVQNCEVFS